ncbi:MAG: hypothetical protein WD063_13130 [Pirellulales bacterium]
MIDFFASDMTARIQQQDINSAGESIRIIAGTRPLGANLFAGWINLAPSTATISCDEPDLSRIEIPLSEKAAWQQMDTQPLPDALLKRLSGFEPLQEWLDEPNDF